MTKYNIHDSVEAHCQVVSYKKNKGNRKGERVMIGRRVNLAVSLLVIMLICTRSFAGSLKDDGGKFESHQDNGIIGWMNQKIEALSDSYDQLSTYVHNLSLIPGPKGDKGDSGEVGPTGPQGPKGDTGQSAQIGAGNIAFTCRNKDGIYALTKNGQVWFCGIADVTNYVGDTWLLKSEFNPPIPPTDIVEWKLDNYLDKGGNMWVRNVESSTSYLVDYYYAVADDFDGICGNIKIAQKFVAAKDYMIQSASILCYKGGNPGIMTAGIYLITDGLPSGNALCTGIFDGNNLTTNHSGEWVNIAFTTKVKLSSGVHYALVISGGIDSGNSLYWLDRMSSPEYAGGSMIRYDESGVWQIYDGNNPIVGYIHEVKIFEIYGGDVQIEFINIGSPPAE